MLLDSDPNTNSFVRVWGAPSRTAEREEKGRAYLVDALRRQTLGEDVTNGAAARPVVAAREGRVRKERVRLSERRERFKKPREEMNLRP